MNNLNPEEYRNKHELKKIMSGALRVNSKSMDISKIRLYCCTEPPSYRVMFLFYIFIITSAWVALAGLIWSLKIEKAGELFYWCGPLMLLNGLIGIYLSCLYRNSQTSKIRSRLHDPLAELAALTAYLEKYTSVIRRRTQTLFRSLSEDALRNLIYLDNIRAAMSEKCKLIKGLLSQDRTGYLLMLDIDYVFRLDLKVYERPDLRSGSSYIINMSDLRDIVETLVANMDMGVDRIETSMQLDYNISTQLD